MWISKKKVSDLEFDAKYWKDKSEEKARQIYALERENADLKKENRALEKKLAACAITYRIEVILRCGKSIVSHITSTKGASHVGEIAINNFLRDNKDFSAMDVTTVLIAEVPKNEVCIL